MVLITTLCGALMAPVRIDTLRLGLALLGTGLVVAAANAFNMYFERDVDAAMERTRTRPLPSGRLAPEIALWFSVITGVAGLLMLALWVNPLSSVLAAAALVVQDRAARVERDDVLVRQLDLGEPGRLAVREMHFVF